MTLQRTVKVVDLASPDPTTGLPWNWSCVHYAVKEWRAAKAEIQSITLGTVLLDGENHPSELSDESARMGFKVKACYFKGGSDDHAMYITIIPRGPRGNLFYKIISGNWAEKYVFVPRWKYRDHEREAAPWYIAGFVFMTIEEYKIHRVKAMAEIALEKLRNFRSVCNSAFKLGEPFTAQPLTDRVLVKTAYEELRFGVDVSFLGNYVLLASAINSVVSAISVTARNLVVGRLLSHAKTKYDLPAGEVVINGNKTLIADPFIKARFFSDKVVEYSNKVVSSLDQRLTGKALLVEEMFGLCFTGVRFELDRTDDGKTVVTFTLTPVFWEDEKLKVTLYNVTNGGKLVDG